MDVCLALVQLGISLLPICFCHLARRKLFWHVLSCEILGRIQMCGEDIAMQNWDSKKPGIFLGAKSFPERSVHAIRSTKQGLISNGSQ